MNRVLVVLLGVMPLVALSWTAGPAPGGGDEAKATGRNHDIQNSIGIKLVPIEPGEFVMGEGDGPPKTRDDFLTRDWDEAPAHKVKITRAFYLGATEVTNAQYELFDPEHKKLRGTSGVSTADDEPVTYVTWQNAVDFCKWLSKKDGHPYRLPTEAEWEYACRGGTRTAYNTGDTLTAEQANLGKAVDGKAQKTRPVGSYKPNAWGLCDMHGNVAEWCHDWYGPYEAGEQSDPVGRAGGYARVVRGWSWLVPAKQTANRYARSANRSGHIADDANACTGFRVVRGELPATRLLPAVVAAYQKDVKQTPAPKEGPDPKKPYLVDFVKAGKNPTMPADAWGPIFAQHNHFSACCVCPNGDVLAVWYTTMDERGRECAQAASRLRAGADAWEPASFFFGVPDVNCHAPVLLTHGRRIAHFCTQSLRGWDSASDIVRWSDDNGATWSQPRILVTRDDPDALSQPCSALVTRDGAIVVACDGDLHKDERFLVSRDDGKTWKVSRGDLRKSAGKYVAHPAMAALGDGSIITFLRGPDPMPAALTKDLGDTFEMMATPLPGISGGQKATALRLASGALLLCSIEGKKPNGVTFAALSLDDGKTWPHVRKLESVGGYMSVAQAPNGVIYLFGSRMTCAAFNEAWLRQGNPLRGAEGRNTNLR
jgi:formylglycine-generating enzyme required for sulfatase activity